MRFSVRVLCYLCSAVFLVVFSAVPPAAAKAQTTATVAGTVTGIVTDPGGAVIAGAQINAEQIPFAGEPERAVSGSDGRFVLTLSPGRYRVTISRDSFTRSDQEITIAAEKPRI